MSKTLGYILSGAGLGVMVLSKGFASVLGLDSSWGTRILVVGVFLVAGGVLTMMSDSSSGKIGKEKQKEVEVPIYEEDKKGNRVIVGYKREVRK